MSRRISRDQPVRSVAHRGAWQDNRENTLPAVAAAIRAGADVVEIDVKTCAGGEVVLVHDDTLQRLWNDPRAVTDCSYAELSALPGPFRIPTLEAVLALIGGTGTAVMIDLDAERWATPALEAVQRAISAGVVTGDEVVWCGRTSALQRIRDADVAARIVLSWDERDGDGAMPPDEHLASLRPEAVNPHWPMIGPDTIAWAGERELPLCCWTVDDEQQMRHVDRPRGAGHDLQPDRVAGRRAGHHHIAVR